MKRETRRALSMHPPYLGGPGTLFAEYEVQLPETIVCNSTLWAACIGGAAQQDNYRGQIAAAGMNNRQ